MSDENYPEHNKLAVVAELSQGQGELLEWLAGQGVVLAQHHEHRDGCRCSHEWHDQWERDDRNRVRHKETGLRYWPGEEFCPECSGDPIRRRLHCGYTEEALAPIHRPIAELLAEYHGIDLEKLEREKRAMLALLRAEGADDAE